MKEGGAACRDKIRQDSGRTSPVSKKERRGQVRSTQVPCLHACSVGDAEAEDCSKLFFPSLAKRDGGFPALEGQAMKLAKFSQVIKTLKDRSQAQNKVQTASTYFLNLFPFRSLSFFVHGLTISSDGET